MTSIVFSKWLFHFIHDMKHSEGISATCRHLIILENHNSHVTLDVVRKAKEVEHDMITLPSHTSYELDVSIFKPSKIAFEM